MKFLARYLILFAVLIGVSVLCATLSYLTVSVLDEGITLAWTKLETPPERAKKVIAPYQIETETGKKLNYEPFPCESNCWQEVTEIKKQLEYPLSVSDCGWYPKTTAYIDSLTTCERWGQGYYKKIWAIDNEGHVWLWEKGMGEGGVIMAIYAQYLGFFGIFVPGCLFLVVFIIDDRISARSLTSGGK